MALRLQNVKVPRLQDNRHMKLVRYSALRICRLYPAGDTLGTLFWLSRSHGRSAAGMITSIKKSQRPPTGIEPAIFLLAAQCLNQLRLYQWYKIQDMSGQTEGKTAKRLGQDRRSPGRCVSLAYVLLYSDVEAFHMTPRGPRANV